MLRTAHAHSLVFVALLAPMLACGDGGSGDDSVEDTACYEREDLWRRVLQDESSTTSVGAAGSTRPAAGATSGGAGDGGGGTGGAGDAGTGGGAGGAGTGGAGDGGAPATTAASSSASSSSGAGATIPDGCPDRDRARPILELDRNVNPDDDDSLSIEAPKQDGESCCYALLQSQGVTGRPVRVDDAIVVASLRRDGAPLAGAVPRAAVAHWEQVARLEHASVASFALLSLDLMAHGAPMDLVADSQRASLDEVRHADAMFAHASRLGGSALEPGEMATLASCRLSPDVDALVAATLRDGCVNETFASFEAAEQAARCDDADLARDLAVIAVDEASHAALGWRIVAWALRTGKTTPDHVAACLRASIAELRAGAATSVSASLERHGVLSGPTRAELAAEVARRLEAIGARVLARCEVARAA